MSDKKYDVKACKYRNTGKNVKTHNKGWILLKFNHVELNNKRKTCYKRIQL